MYFCDIFAGAGGFTLGLESIGYRNAGAVERDAFACDTYRANFPNHQLIQDDVTNLSKRFVNCRFSGIDMLVGGPPCQGFSVAGPAQYGRIDARNNLLFEMVRLATILRPRVCVIENVKGLLSGRMPGGGPAFTSLVAAFREQRYHTAAFVLQAADFGVPQWRERVFVIAARDKQLIPSTIRRTFGTAARPWRTVDSALSDLPQVAPGEGTEHCVPYVCSPRSSYQASMRRGSPGIANHVAMKHTPRLIERFKRIPIGGSLVDVPAEYGQRVRNGTTIDVRPRFKMNNQRLDPEKVATAITASFQSNFVHPVLHRNLTAREGARLQSFPDSFVFCGPRTLMSKTLLRREGRNDEIGLSQYNQIGNAVPPLLAAAVGRSIFALGELRHAV